MVTSPCSNYGAHVHPEKGSGQAHFVPQPDCSVSVTDSTETAVKSGAKTGRNFDFTILNTITVTSKVCVFDSGKVTHPCEGERKRTTAKVVRKNRKTAN